MCAGIALLALRSGVAFITFLALRSGIALLALRSGVAFITFLALRSGIAFITFLALRAGIAFVALLALRSGISFVTLFALRSGVAFVTLFALCAGIAGNRSEIQTTAVVENQNKSAVFHYCRFNSVSRRSVRAFARHREYEREAHDNTCRDFK